MHRFHSHRFAHALSLAALLSCGAGGCGGAQEPAKTTISKPQPAKTPEALVCAAGTANCDGDLSNSCETKLDASPQHCGACGQACAAGESCAAGNCRRLSILASSSMHTCSVKNDGSVYCWGDNKNAALGTDAAALPTPKAQRVANVSGAIAVRPNAYFSCAILGDGRVQCWGDDHLPTIMHGFDNAIDAGIIDLSLCIVHRGGDVACGDAQWEKDEEGPPQLRAVQGIKNAVALASGSRHGCALLATGEVACFGDKDKLASTGSAPQAENENANENADESDDGKYKSVLVKNLKDAVQISSKENHTCAVRKNGQIACWGENWSGQLGSGDREEHDAPVAVQFISDAVAVATGNDHTCALRRTGEIACWGRGASGELGNGSYDSSEGPVAVNGINDAVAIAAGEQSTCAMRKSGAVMCWGSTERGRLGNGAMAEQALPHEISGIEDATRVSLARNYSCALRQGGKVSCWGRGPYGEHGKEYRERGIPANLVDGISDAIDLRADDRFACAVKAQGETFCFRGGVPAYKDGASENAAWKAELVQGLAPAKTVIAGGDTALALLRTGQPILWNSNAIRRSVWDTKEKEKKPSPPEKKAMGNISDAIDIAGDSSVLCAVRRSGKVACMTASSWGTFDKKKPVKPGEVFEIPDIDDAIHVAHHEFEICAAGKSGKVRCWRRYQLPSPIRPDDKKPAAKPAKKDEPKAKFELRNIEGIESATMVAVGWSFRCALLRSGEIACAGAGGSGQLGNGAYKDSSEAVRVQGINDAIYIAASSNHACAVRKNGHVLCWGSNSEDQIGHPDPSSFASPVNVIGLDK